MYKIELEPIIRNTNRCCRNIEILSELKSIVLDFYAHIAENQA
jgi:hypothetical protein